MDVGNNADHPQPKPVVVLEGSSSSKEGSSSSAEEASAVKPFGPVEVGELDYGGYFFRVALPENTSRSNLQCEIEREGNIFIKGTITDSEVLNSSSTVPEEVQQPSPPEQFTISFKLPGPVDPRLCKSFWGPDNVLEVKVIKYMR